MSAKAYSNNDIAVVAWNTGRKISGCMGFCVERIDLALGSRTVLPSWVGFADDADSRPKKLADGRTQRTRKTTDVWPVQKFVWRDFTARAGGKYQYVITAMIEDAAGTLVRGDWTATSNEVDLTPLVSDHVACYFNRGILSTQALTEQIPLTKTKAGKFVRASGWLTDHLTTIGDPLRARLGGTLINALQIPIERAKATGGHCHASLYELNDPDLVPALRTPVMNLILTDAGVNDATNATHRKDLHDSGMLESMLDRYMPTGHIGHNKFVVCSDKDGNGEAVLSGSTNWTHTGTCGQSNNAILLHDTVLAKAYLDYWQALKQDTEDSGNTVPPSGGNVTKGPQRKAFRAANAANPVDTTIDGSSVRVWFSPNSEAYNKSTGNPVSAVDLDHVNKRIANAKQGIIFLAFQPGTPSVVDAIAEAKRANPALFVRGAATSGSVASGFNTSLYHRDASNVDLVVTATEIKDDFDYWAKELLKLGFAVIHDKIVVIDPFSDDCVVVTGSHNLGVRASTNNDENMLIIKGHRKLAAAYATHVMDVYDHYRWRFQLQSKPREAAYAGLDKTPAWQEKYFSNGGTTPTQEIAFWLGG